MEGIRSFYVISRNTVARSGLIYLISASDTYTRKLRIMLHMQCNLRNDPSVLLGEMPQIEQSSAL